MEAGQRTTTLLHPGHSRTTHTSKRESEAEYVAAKEIKFVYQVLLSMSIKVETPIVVRVEVYTWQPVKPETQCVVFRNEQDNGVPSCRLQYCNLPQPMEYIRVWDHPEVL